jgi:hypothetical protein
LLACLAPCLDESMRVAIVELVARA